MIPNLLEIRDWSLEPRTRFRYRRKNTRLHFKPLHVVLFDEIIRWNNEFGIRCQTLIPHLYKTSVGRMLSGILYSRYDCSRPLWNSIVDLYDVSVGDLRRRFVSSDLAVRCVHVSFVLCVWRVYESARFQFQSK